jgi:hypothetical protein
MNAAAQILDAFEGPEVLAAYIIMREGAYAPPGRERDRTDCGAKSIATYAGCSDWRGKRTLEDLKSIRFGERGELALVHATGETHRNALVYFFDRWDSSSDDAYLPSIFVKVPGEIAMLRRLCELDIPSEQKRDMLFMLLRLYADTDYGGWMGAPPDVFVHQKWDSDGEREVGDMPFELGVVESIDRFDLWLVSPPEDGTWWMSKRTASLFGDKARAWSALWLLLEHGFACKVAIVSVGRENYPMWVFNAAYRESLRKLGIVPDLADEMHRLACDAGADPDNWLIRQTTSDDLGPEGTGVFFCASSGEPTVRTILVPRIHAPTPLNMDGLANMAAVTKNWSSRVRQLRRIAKAA